MASTPVSPPPGLLPRRAHFERLGPRGYKGRATWPRPRPTRRPSAPPCCACSRPPPVNMSLPRAAVGQAVSASAGLSPLRHAKTSSREVNAAPSQGRAERSRLLHVAVPPLERRRLCARASERRSGDRRRFVAPYRCRPKMPPPHDSRRRDASKEPPPVSWDAPEHYRPVEPEPAFSSIAGRPPAKKFGGLRLYPTQVSTST
jgi:hypothetical protein